MSRINPECADSETPDHWVATDVLFRQDPEDDEEDENGGKHKEDDDDDQEDDGYSE
jgi:hypothetical protein